MATQTTEHKTGTETGLLTAATYPLFAPYTRHGNPDDTATLTGKPPRLMSIITTTLILTGSTCWNAEERTLTFGHDWQRLAGRLKLINGGATRDVLNNLLAAYCTEPFPTEDGDILIAEDAALDPDITTSRRWIRFTPEYLDLVTEHEAKEIPLDAIPGPAIELDLLVLAALYTPDDRRLVIPAAALGELLPGGKWTIKTSRYLQAAKHLNSTQGKWVFAFESRSLIITPAGIDPDRKGLVMRVY